MVKTLWTVLSTSHPQRSPEKKVGKMENEKHDRWKINSPLFVDLLLVECVKSYDTSKITFQLAILFCSFRPEPWSLKNKASGKKQSNLKFLNLQKSEINRAHPLYSLFSHLTSAHLRLNKPTSYLSTGFCSTNSKTGNPPWSARNLRASSRMAFRKPLL